MAEYLFYRLDGARDGAVRTLPAGYEARLWRPGWFRWAPRGLAPTARLRYAVWTLFHFLRIFWNRDYSVVVARHGDEAVHHTLVTPPYFRFPFMAPEDLQFGDVWTDPAHRGRGLAGAAMDLALAGLDGPGRTFWWVVDESNESSVRVAQKAGFELYGRGVRTRRWGLRALGAFEVRTGHGE